MSITPAQQRLLDQCEDGDMSTLDLAVSIGQQHESVARLVYRLARGGYVDILSTRRVKVRASTMPHRPHQTYVNATTFRLTIQGLTQHAPPPDFD